jgi:hypothetical protein
MSSSTATMKPAVNQVRSARKTLETKASDERATTNAAATEVKEEPKSGKVKAPKPPLRYRIRLMLTGAAVAFALVGASYVAFGPGGGEMGPPEGFEGAPPSGVSGPPAGVDAP